VGKRRRRHKVARSYDIRRVESDDVVNNIIEPEPLVVLPTVQKANQKSKEPLNREDKTYSVSSPENAGQPHNQYEVPVQPVIRPQVAESNIVTPTAPSVLQNASEEINLNVNISALPDDSALKAIATGKAQLPKAAIPKLLDDSETRRAPNKVHDPADLVLSEKIGASGEKERQKKAKTEPSEPTSHEKNESIETPEEGIPGLTSTLAPSGTQTPSPVYDDGPFQDAEDLPSVLGNSTITLSPTLPSWTDSETLANQTAPLVVTMAPSLAAMEISDTKDIGEGIVVVTQQNNGSESMVLAIDSTNTKLIESKAYQPPVGWESIASVFAFGSLFFFPVVIVYGVRYIHRRLVQGIPIQHILREAGSALRTWYFNFVRLRNCRGEELANIGSEGALYLAIQRESTVLICLMMVFSCAVLLPMHIVANDSEVEAEFTRGTIKHLDATSKFLWAHVCFVYLFTFLYYGFMARCRAHVKWAWTYGVLGARSVDVWDASVFVKSKLPNFLSDTDIRNLLNELFPDQVLNVVLIKDRFDKDELERRRKQLEGEIHTIRQLEGSFTNRKFLRTGAHDVPEDNDASQSRDSSYVSSPVEVSTEERESLIHIKKSELARITAMQEGLDEKHAGKCIVSFSSVEPVLQFSDLFERQQAIRAAVESRTHQSRETAPVFRDSDDHYSKRLEASRPPSVHLHQGGVLSTLSRSAETEVQEAAPVFSSGKELIAIFERTKVGEWEVVPSPDPHDIIWGSLHLNPAVFWFRTVLANLVVAILLGLVTMPTTMVTLASHILDPSGSSETHESGLDDFWVDAMNSLRVSHPTLASFLFAFLPQLVIVLVNNALMFVVCLIVTKWEPHHTCSAQQVSMMKRMFWFLFLSTFVVPALAFKSMNSFVGDLISTDASPFSLLGQVFVATSGAFTVNYIIANSMVGAAFQMVNISNCFLRFAVNWCWPWATEADRQSARETKISFDFGLEYAVFLSVLALVTIFSTTVPVILPFGLLHQLIKSGVDQYQLNYECGNENSHSVPRCRIGRAAVQYLAVPLLMFQLGMLGYFSSYVCMPNEIFAVATGRNPKGCSVPSEADPDLIMPGTQVIRGSILQLLLLTGLLLYTASDLLNTHLVDIFNDTKIAKTGFVSHPFENSRQKFRRADHDTFWGVLLHTIAFSMFGLPLESQFSRTPKTPRTVLGENVLDPEYVACSPRENEESSSGSVNTEICPLEEDWGVILGGETERVDTSKVSRAADSFIGHGAIGRAVSPAISSSDSSSTGWGLEDSSICDRFGRDDGEACVEEESDSDNDASLLLQ